MSNDAAFVIVLFIYKDLQIGMHDASIDSSYAPRELVRMLWASTTILNLVPVLYYLFENRRKPALL